MKALLAPILLMLAGCATPHPAPRDLFAGLSTLCGKAFAGRIASPPVAADASFAGKRLVMHVRECSRETIRIPFHVGDDASRTWVVTRTSRGLRLKHDHRHRDGSQDKLTQYGGDSAGTGAGPRVQFPADAFTRALLVREGNAAGAANVWAIALVGRTFVYELRRPGRFFRVEFDLSRPLPAPPAPWGGR